jgi:hypothetical protein
MSRAMTTIHAQEMSETATSDAMRAAEGLRAMTPDCRRDAPLDATTRPQQYSI